MNERNLNEGQWEDRKQWSLGVGQRRTTLLTVLFTSLTSSISYRILVAWSFSVNNKAISACLLSTVFCLRESTVILGATRLTKSVHYLTYHVVFVLQISTLTELQ